MLRRKKTDWRHREALLLAHHGNPRAERRHRDRWQLDRGTRERQRAQRRYFMCRCVARREQRIRRQPTYVAVAGKLTPGPALVVELIHRYALAHQRLGHQWRVG